MSSCCHEKGHPTTLRHGFQGRKQTHEQFDSFADWNFRALRSAGL